MEICGNSHVEI